MTQYDPRRPIPAYGEHMPLDEFVQLAREESFIDDDGHGYYANKGWMSTELIAPSDVIGNKILEGWTHVVWFNK